MRKAKAHWFAIVFVTVLAAALLLTLGLPPTVALSVDDLVSYHRLANAQWFAGPAVGIGGEEPRESKALRALASHPDGGKAFKYLLLTGSPAGRMYALVGLRHTNPRLFRIVVQPYRFFPGEVETIFGCVGQKVETREVVETKGPNPVRLQRGETINHWWKRRKPGGEVNIDILGGGYTSMFIDFDELRRPQPNSTLERTSARRAGRLSCTSIERAEAAQL